jgi:acetylornithine/succinyldiaminopimelate/putrescine aminotransferase
LIETASGASLTARDGRKYLDLSMGYGSVWLGHGDPAVTRALQAQAARYAAPGYLQSGAFEAAEAALAPFLPPTHFLGGIYSTGMEAVEAALRAVWAHTGRLDLAGFEGSEHGRSFVASALGAAPAHGDPAFVHRLPGFADPRAAQAALERLAATASLAAVVVEPIQMTGGGHAIDPALCARLFALAREKGFAVIFDEALTAPWRCGARLYADLAGEAPDVVVLGKGLGNGFPCAAVALRRGFTWERARVRPSSTFWNHPLACAAMTATLGEIAKREPARAVAAIEATVRETLGALVLRGRGAMWCVGVPDAARQAEFAARLLEAGIVTSYYPGYVRLLPPLSIDPAALRRGCEAIRAVHADTFR